VRPLVLSTTCRATTCGSWAVKDTGAAPWVIWQALCDPFRSEDRQWLDVRPGEQPPTVLSETKPRSGVWSSIWRDLS
jgi:hypothetical protein